jgi:hypothetical protein
MLSTTSERIASTRTKLAELTSGIGALVLGIGIGALFAPMLRTTAVAVTLTGLALHSFGMWDKHRLEARAVPDSPPWVQAAYWICWIMLAILAVAITMR